MLLFLRLEEQKVLDSKSVGTGCCGHRCCKTSNAALRADPDWLALLLGNRPYSLPTPCASVLEPLRPHPQHLLYRDQLTGADGLLRGCAPCCQDEAGDVADQESGGHCKFPASCSTRRAQKGGNSVSPTRRCLACQVRQRVSTSGGKSVSFSYHPSQNHLKEACEQESRDHVCFSRDLISLSVITCMT